ncbi:DUF927 domain-containing protein [Geobacter anodireducens]|uniref:DUF927 domain-containing protein n=1 Tax=Geobacter soli TaxID=1510391 RepID=UPI00068F1391|nr:DUF927 domain-containing protein [Geobacter soli]
MNNIKDNGVAVDGQDDSHIVIVTREHDVALLRAQGLTAMTVEESGKGDAAEIFSGKKVVLIASDHNGADQALSSALSETSRSFMVIALPGRDDGNVGAWLEQQGNCLGKFVELLREAVPLNAVVPPEPGALMTIPGPTVAGTGDDLRWFHSNHGHSSEAADPIWVVADLCDPGKKNCKRLVAFIDRHGNEHLEMFPLSWFSGQSPKIIKVLLDCGFPVPPRENARNSLIDFLYSSKPKKPAPLTTLSSTGWHGSVFALPNRIIGPGNNLYWYDGPKGADTGISQRGTVQEWQEKIGRLCIGNRILVIAVSMAFAGPVLEPMGIENGGIHFKGKNGTGKTTSLRVAASVCGGSAYHKQWSATTNGLESLGMQHNNLLLILDELGRGNPKDAGDAVYLLGNGSGKIRMNGNEKGSSRAGRFSLIFISNGEISLRDHVATAGKMIIEGQTDRFVEIPAEPENGYGVFEQLHGFASGDALSDYLRLQCGQCHGAPLITYLTHLTHRRAESERFLTEMMDKFHKEFVPEGDRARLARVARRFSIIAAAGELATLFGVTGWPQGEALRCAGLCFQAWLSSADRTCHPHRDRLFAFLEAHGDSRFCPVGGNPEEFSDFAGFRHHSADGSTEFFITPKTFKEEIFSGCTCTRVCNELAKMGILIRDGDGHNTRLKRQPGSDNPSRYYHVISPRGHQNGRHPVSQNTGKTGYIWQQPEFIGQ